MLVLKPKHTLTAVPMSIRQYHEDYLKIEHPPECGEGNGFLVTLGFDEFADQDGPNPQPIVQWMSEEQFNYVFTYTL